MKSKSFIALALILALSVLPCRGDRRTDSLSFAAVDWGWTDIGRGAQVGSVLMSLFDSPQSISVVRYPARRFHTELVSAEGPEAAPTDSLAIRAGGGIALNGSFFNMATREHGTFFCLDGTVLSESRASEEVRSNGVFAVRGAHWRKIGIFPYEAGRTEVYRRRWKAAIATGPLLLLSGQCVPADPSLPFNHTRHPRSMAGVSRDGYVWLVVVDGRFPGQAEGMSIAELATVASWLGLWDAINFDGGGSSTLWTSRTGIISHPSGNRQFDHAGTRTVPNIIVAR